METIKVKLVVFKHPNPDVWRKYCGYCHANRDALGRGETIEEVEAVVREHLLLGLRIRNTHPQHLRKFGWEVSEKSIKVPMLYGSIRVGLPPYYENTF